MDTVKCEQCGTEMPRSTRFCPECGRANAAAVLGTTGDNPVPGTGPVGGTPTVNIRNADEPLPGQYAAASQETRYIPPTQVQTGYSQSTPQTQFAQPQNYAQTQNFNQPGNVLPPAIPAYSQNPATYPAQAGYVSTGLRDSIIPLLLELVGYVGFLGIGHIVAGRVVRGIALMVGWWLYWGICALFFFTLVLSPLACLMAILWPVVPILSGIWIKMDIDKENALIRPRY